ncbi:helix-turn-helix domain-containing protein [Nocardioides sp. Kera G14]|uniref:nSTAND1 domain-containing NTPase n=1 Tax=Nocardioides sp. Kera G14 TaxID=2884264 RepID=UPI001D0FBE67|nr:helix-turn-helix domain-containing protein [Nocardioides sp. Kera G14]UDY23730.1 helix-turn-helix domain-containing protein [Nocardioides sp. Kera G14]
MPVDPAAVSSQESFTSALAALRARQGLTVRAVSQRTGIPTATLGGYFSGRHLPAISQVQSLDALLVALGVEAEQLPEWHDALGRARRASAQSSSRASAPGTNPYRGLSGFDIDDRDIFFGRTTLMERCCELATALVERSGPHWMTLVGASGSGKSSLMRAGILADRKATGDTTHVLMPGADPLRALDAVEHVLGSHEGPLSLGVDQLEELFSPIVDETTRAVFLSRLTALAERSDVLVIATLRADFFARSIAEPSLVPLLQENVVIVGPMTRDELEEAITRPAELRGRTVDPHLVDLVLTDAKPYFDQSPVLPLVSEALRATWERASGARITASDYLATGRIDHAIQTAADAAWGQLSDTDRGLARKIFRALTVVSADGQVTRQPIPIERLAAWHGAPGAAVVETFVDYRILTVKDEELSVAHESLFAAWPRLQAWTEEDRETLHQMGQLRHAAQTWTASGRPDELLARGMLLRVVAAADEAARSDQLVLSADEEAFVDASLARQRAHLERKRRAVRRQKWALAGVTGLCVALAVLALVLVTAIRHLRTSEHEAQRVRDQARSRQIALQAQSVAVDSPEVARALAVAAYRTSPTVEARSALLETSLLPQVTRLLGSPGTTRAVFSPAGGTVAVAGADGEIHFNSRDGSSATALSRIDEGVRTAPVDSSGDEREQVYASAFSPDGSHFAAGGTSGVVTLVDLTDPATPTTTTLTGATSAIQGLAFSPDGRELAAATSDPALLRWSLSDADATPLPAVTKPFAGSVQSVAYAPDGTLVTGSADGAVRLWRAGPGGRLVVARTLQVGEADIASVQSVSVSPDGRLLAAGGKDATVHVWALKGTTATAVRNLDGFPSWVNSVAFSHDGGMLAAGASGGVTKVWDTGTWAPRADLPSTANVTSVDFAPDGRSLATGAVDGTVRLVKLSSARLPDVGGAVWSLTYPDSGRHLYVGVSRDAHRVSEVDVERPLQPASVGRQYVGTESAVSDGVSAISPDGRTLVGGTSSGEILLWDTSAPATGTGSVAPTQVLTDDGALTENMAFSRDGRRFAAVTDSNQLDVWSLDATGHAALDGRLAMPALPLGIAFSPDGDTIAVGSDDHTVTLVDAQSLDPVATMKGFDNYVYGLAFSPDGRLLAAASADRTIRMWDVHDRSHPARVGAAVRGPRGTLYSLVFDGTGHHLAAASGDGAAWLWTVDAKGSAHSFARLGNLTPDDPIYAVAFDPHNPVLAAAGASGRAGLWSIDPTAVMTEACRTLGTPLSRDEWAMLIPGVPYRDPCLRR